MATMMMTMMGFGRWRLFDKRKDANHGLCRFAAPVLFPILDSFPGTVLSVLGSTSHGKVAVHSGLTTSTEVGEQVRAVEAIVRRMHMVGIDEREGLCDGLQTMAEEYEHGWDSGSDSDADE